MPESKVFTVRLPEEILAPLGIERAEDIREALRVLLLSRPQGLTEAEERAVMDATLSWSITPETAQYLWAEVEDAIRLEGLDRKWGVDGQALVEKLRGLCPAEAWALIQDLRAKGAMNVES
jgi:hypothetical protein